MRGGSVELGPGLHRSLCCRSSCAVSVQYTHVRLQICRCHLPASAVGLGRTDNEARKLLLSQSVLLSKESRNGGAMFGGQQKDTVEHDSVEREGK
jgi:hypothetical protein